MTWQRWRRVRQGVQVVALALFVYLLFAALQRRTALPLADLFFRLDPLSALSAMLASRSWIPRLAPALLTVGLTLALGRVWCGWLCPLGTLQEWVRFPGAAERAHSLSPRWRQARYLLLLVTLAAALFGSLTLLALDPLAILTRTAATAILPALDRAVTALESVLYPLPFLQPALDRAEALLRGPVLPVEQPAFHQAAWLAVLFAGLLALGALADRFWCRYLCPLGALLGLLSKASLLRPTVGPACNRCGRCEGACRPGAIAAGQGQEILPAECTLCLDCLAECPEGGIALHLPWRADPFRRYDPTRRQLLAALAVGAAGVAVLRTGVGARVRDPRLVRPPGMLSEEAFLARCLRCSQCLKVCPTSGLQPSLLESGLEGLWTPRLVARLGYCDYGCNACGQVCPSGAVPPLDLEAKRQAVMGLAVIDRNRCLPWAHGLPCIVCEEMCPRPDKAIRLEEAAVPDDLGRPAVVQRPYVNQDLCFGCGICEYRCPVGGEAAIRVNRR